jgi:single-strand DNA-binding protein
MNINAAIIVGNLTRDPELRVTGGGTNICTLRVAVNDRVKDQNTGQWGDRPNYFNVDVFGGQAEQCAKFLSRGRQVAVSGRLRWREWEKDGAKREAVSIVADTVQFLGPKLEQTASGLAQAAERAGLGTAVGDDDEEFGF